MIVTMAPFSLIGFGVQNLVNLITGDPNGQLIWKIAQTLGLVLSAAFVVWYAITRSRTRPVSFLAWAYLAFASFGPAPVSYTHLDVYKRQR